MDKDCTQLTVRICFPSALASDSKCSARLKSTRSVDVSKRLSLCPIFVSNYPMLASILPSRKARAVGTATRTHNLHTTVLNKYMLVSSQAQHGR